MGSAQIASGAITGLQISNLLELGSTTADGSLSVWDNGTDLQTIRLVGGSGDIFTYSSDGLVEAVLAIFFEGLW